MFKDLHIHKKFPNPLNDELNNKSSSSHKFIYPEYVKKNFQFHFSFLSTKHLIIHKI